MSGTEQERAFDGILQERISDFDLKVVIAVVGRVGTGKSSLLNAFLGLSKEEQKFAVAATSGVQPNPHKFDAGDNVVIIDTYGLSDPVLENSQVTIDMLQNIDVGIFVINGSVDDVQVQDYERLKKFARKVFIAFNLCLHFF